MSDLEAKIKITAENNATAALNSVARDTDQAADRISQAGEKASGGFEDALAEITSLLRQIVGTVDNGMKEIAESIERGAEKAEQQLGKIGDGFGKLGELLAGFATIKFAQSVMHTADSMQVMNNQVRQVVASEQEYVAVKNELLALANRTNADIEATSNLYVKTSRALKDYGYTQQEILKFTEATNNAMTIGGVEAQQQAAALMQLSQALGSGVLQGDEFKSIAEAAPILLDTIAEYMGKSRAEIKKLGSEGELTADVIFKAISGASEKFSEQASQMPKNLGQSLTVFQNNWKTFVNNLMNDTGVMSAVARVVQTIAENLNLIIPIIGGLTVAVVALTAPTLAATAAAWGLNAALLANPITIVAVSIGAIIGLLLEFGDDITVCGHSLTEWAGIGVEAADMILEAIGELVDMATGWFDDLTGWLHESVGSWQDLFDRVMSAIFGFVQFQINAVVNVFATGYMLVTEAWNNAPQFFGNLGASIANVFLAAIEGMVNKAIGLVNNLIGFANSAASLVGASPIAKLENVSIGRMNDGGLSSRITGSLTKDRVGDFYRQAQIRQMAANSIKADNYGTPGSANAKPSNPPKPAGGGGGGGGRSGGRKAGGRGRGGGGAGREQDPFQQWQEEINAQKLAHETMRLQQKTHGDWNIANELSYWRQKLAIVDANSKAGQRIQGKINDLEKQLAKQSTEAKLQQIREWEKADEHRLAMEVEAADHALAMGQITKLQRLDAEIEFENRRYQIAYDALQERIALAEQDPTYSQAAIDRLKQQTAELGQKHEQKQAGNHNKREQQQRKDAPSLTDMFKDGGESVWEQAQNAMSQAFTAMFTRAQNFRTAITNVFKSIYQSFVQEMVTKPLMALIKRAVEESSIWQMIFTKKAALETAGTATTLATKQTETTAVVGQNAVQAASGAAASQAGIPYVGPMLAVAAMGAMMAAVMGLIGGGGGSSTTTTTTRIPSAANGWDIPAGINPLTQLHENEMVLPAEQAQVIRDMAGGGSSETIIISTTGGDFIHKKDLAKLLKQMKRDFKLT